MALDLDAKGKPAYGLFEAHGGGRDEQLPEQPRAVATTEYKFTSTGLRGGPNRLLFSNTGKQPHEVVAYPLNRGATIADVRRWARSGRGRPPVDTAHGDRTAILDGKRQELVQLDLRAGKYAFVCFSRDRQGGPEHSRKGMVSAVVVR